jgi:flagellum-specific ATP synthase
MPMPKVPDAMPAAARTAASSPPNPHLQAWRATLAQARSEVGQCASVATSGRLTRAVGLVLEAVGLQLPVGSDCLIELPPGYAQRHA